MTANTRKAKPKISGYTIFASYSHEDDSLVSQILTLFDVTKESVFFDRRSITPGRKWQAATNQALRTAQKLLVFWCSHSAASVEVRKEYERAIELNKRVVPILMDSTTVSAALQAYQWIDLRQVFGSSHKRDHDTVAHDAVRAEWNRGTLYHRAPDWYYVYDVIRAASRALARGLESLDKNLDEQLVSGSAGQPLISQTCPKCQVSVDAKRLESPPETIWSSILTGGSVLVACPVCGSRWFASELKPRRDEKAAEDKNSE